MQRREIYLSRLHLDAADGFVEASRSDGLSEEDNATAAIVFSVFAIEALLNRVGEQLFHGL